MAGSEVTSSQYIQHHLTNWTYGLNPETGEWGFAHSAQEAAAMGFNAIHVDSMMWSIGLIVIAMIFFRGAAKKASAETPTGFQNFVEMIVDFVDDAVRGSLI